MTSWFNTGHAQPHFFLARMWFLVGGLAESEWLLWQTEASGRGCQWVWSWPYRKQLLGLSPQHSLLPVPTLKASLPLRAGEEVSLPCRCPSLEGPGLTWRQSWRSCLARRVSGWWKPHTFSSLLPGLALTHVLEQNLKPAAGPRPEAAKVVILVTDGKSQDDTRAAGRTLRSLDVDIFAVGEQPSLGRVLTACRWELAHLPTPSGLESPGLSEPSPSVCKMGGPIPALGAVRVPTLGSKRAGTCREAAVTAEGHEPVCMSVNIFPLSLTSAPVPAAIPWGPVR